MISSPRNSVTHNQQAKLAVDYNELLKELSSHEMTSVGCYTIGETIGEGTFGKVKKGFHKLTGRLVAIKKISKQHAPMMAREIHHHRQLKHPNIVMLYEMITTESTIHIISEYCPNGDLLDALTLSVRCSEIRVHKWFRQLTDAINYCHTRGIVHRDLKLENILLDADDNVKICDFGFARFTQKNQYLETFCGSLSYSAPEVILRNKYTGPETDIWSLGVILYTLIAGEYPFDDESEIVVQRKIVNVDYQLPFYFDSNLCDLISNMLQFEPSKRITIENIIDHAWMINIEQETCLTPSSSTTTNQSDLESLDDHIILSPDLKFSPQVRSILSPSIHQQQMNNKSPRFSAPSLNRPNSNPSIQYSYRSSLPSSFHQSKESDISYMSPIEQRLFAALTAAGFDKDALIKMQTGECDTSSTLWHLLLENMSTTTIDQPIASVTDAFASAIKSHQTKQSIDRAIQTGIEEQTDLQPHQSGIDVTLLEHEAPIKAYPTPVTTNKPIQTVGFGSTTNTNHLNEKSGWFTSVKSWFGSKQQLQQQQQQQQQQLQMMQQQNELIIKHQQKQNRPSSNCSTMSSPIASPSSYRDFDALANDSPEGMMMSPPIYRSGSQKYRRRVLQLSQPPISELDQLTYNGTYSTHSPNIITNTTNTSLHQYHAPHTQFHMHQVNMPPTALTTRSLVADSFSILSDSCQPKEIDICEKRYSLYRPQPTPPPSPPVEAAEVQPVLVEQEVVHNLHCQPINPMDDHTLISLSSHSSTNDLQEIKNNLSDFSSDSSDDGSSISDCEESIAPIPEPIRPRSNRFEFTPRSRLSVYGMQDQRGMNSKTIIEEEEEEDE